MPTIDCSFEHNKYLFVVRIDEMNCALVMGAREVVTNEFEFNSKEIRLRKRSAKLKSRKSKRIESPMSRASFASSQNAVAVRFDRFSRTAIANLVTVKSLIYDRTTENSVAVQARDQLRQSNEGID